MVTYNQQILIFFFFCGRKSYYGNVLISSPLLYTCKVYFTQSSQPCFSTLINLGFEPVKNALKSSLELLSGTDKANYKCCSTTLPPSYIASVCLKRGKGSPLAFPTVYSQVSLAHFRVKQPFH